ncbi:hypothetical protein Cpir12675_004442 [Ceratocystis pirilliformis]|uniref:Uncharacterized protein n=1 Tax=Ceratocystis pirilliformis TaxID=259994 RepID=A0ABR3YY84_9PEZI
MENFDMADQTRTPQGDRNPPPAPRLNTQRQTRLSVAETAETSPGTITNEPAPTAKPTNKTKGSFSKLLDTVWEETCREREAKKIGAATLMRALDQFEANPGLGEDKRARLEADSLLKEVKELVANRLRQNLAGSAPSQARVQQTHRPKIPQANTPMTCAQKAVSGTKAAPQPLPAKPTTAGITQAKPQATPKKEMGNRYLATLYEDSKWKKVNTSITRQRLNQEVFKGQDKVTKVTETRTGLALTMKEAVMDREMKEIMRNFLGAAEIEKESIWEKFVIPKIPSINTVENNKLVSRRTSLEDVRKEVQEAFGGTIKSMAWREYEWDPSMQGLRIAVHQPVKVPRTIEILGLTRTIRSSGGKPRPPRNVTAVVAPTRQRTATSH